MKQPSTYMNEICQVNNLSPINIWKKDMYYYGQEVEKMTTSESIESKQDEKKQKHIKKKTV